MIFIMSESRRLPPPPRPMPVLLVLILVGITALAYGMEIGSARSCRATCLDLDMAYAGRDGFVCLCAEYFEVEEKKSHKGGSTR